MHRVGCRDAERGHGACHYPLQAGALCLIQRVGRTLLNLPLDVERGSTAENTRPRI